MDIWNNWLLIAFVAPFLWALVNIIDVYFVESVYEDEYDGAMISGIFQIAPWLLVPFGMISFTLPATEAGLLAFFGGSLFLFSFFFYFRALFSKNDVALIQVLWSLSVPLVPFLAWLFIGERLALLQYMGIVIAFIGAICLSLDPKIRSNGFAATARIMVLAIFLLSLSMVIEARAYTLAGDFWSIFLLFSLGAAITGTGLSFFDKKGYTDRLQHIAGLSRKYFLVFFLAETLALLGTLTSQRAIDLSPAVSFVAVIESLVPAFVLGISFLLSVMLFEKNRKLARRLYRDQLVGIRMKMVSIAIIAFGIYLIA